MLLGGEAPTMSMSILSTWSLSCFSSESSLTFPALTSWDHSPIHAG